MRALLSFLYGLAAYGVCVAALLYLVAFTGDLPVPVSVDRGVAARWPEAVFVDLLLLAAFGVQHSVMARQSFKRWWTAFVPRAVERSTYVLATSLVLALLFTQWRPIAQPVAWSVQQPAAAGVLAATFWLGWALVLFSSFLINHFELFGLQQVYARLTGRRMPAIQFRTPLLYRHVRHPLYLGLLLGLWSTPVMTAGHLLFAAGSTVYILVGVWFEERDLVAQFGERYLRYRTEAGMLLPKLGRARR
jgi:protein-S-isoprenylcysteine O-methyltransferase Ste14